MIVKCLLTTRRLGSAPYEHRLVSNRQAGGRNMLYDDLCICPSSLYSSPEDLHAGTRLV